MTKSETNWRFKGKKQEKDFKESITMKNCGKKLKLVMNLLKISRREFARILGVSEATLRRLMSEESWPTDEFMHSLQALCVIGAAKYKKLSASDKENISEMMGVTGGTVAGVGGSIAAIGAAGTISGFSAAGITSGLAAVGGGAMLTGIGVVAFIPVSTGLLGYGLVKGIKKICEANKLSCQEVNGKWEITKKSNESNLSDNDNK